MYDLECKLIRTTLTTNSIGVQNESYQEITVPIIRVEDVYSKEYYEANAQGFHPSLRIVLNILNYDNERELKYMGTEYTIIRVQNGKTLDEIVLICERKAKNV